MIDPIKKLLEKDNVSETEINFTYPLSPMQASLLFHTLCEAEADHDFNQYVFKIEGKIDIILLKEALQKVIDFYPILRTSFNWEGFDIPVQYVQESVCVSFNSENWINITKEEKDQRLKDFIMEDAQIKFDLKKAALLRFYIIQYDLNHYYLICTYHPILLDERSFINVFKDIFKVYEDIKQGKEALLSTYETYHNYINWIQQQDLLRSKDFWKEYFSFLEIPTSLALKNINKENSLNSYSTCKSSISIAEIEKLKKFIKEHDLTLSTIIQGAVGIIVSNYNQHQEVILGITGSSIGFPKIKKTLGPIINILPLRIQFELEETIASFLKRVQDQTQKLYNYAHTPLSQVQSWVETEQNLFDIVVDAEEYTLDEEAQVINNEFSVKFLKQEKNTRYPITIVARLGKELQISINYQPIYFKEEFIKAFIERFRLVLQKILYQPNDSPLSFSVVIDEEKKKLLENWNSIKSPYPQDECIHEQFERQVKKTPENIAIVHDDIILTYVQLNEKANQLAHHLRKVGIGPKMLVGIYTYTSPDMIIALLAVLKAGGGYIPVDTLYPEDRLNYMLLNAGVKLVITNNELRKNLSSDLACLSIDNDFSTYSVDNFPCVNVPQDLIYVLYTSGSTGWPKGALLRHQGVSNLLNFYTKEFDMKATDKVLIISSFSFDLTQKNILGMLLVGGSIYLRSSSYYDPFDIAEDISNNKITLLNCTPSGFYPLIEEVFPLTQLNSLKKVFLGGEPISTNRLQPIINDNLPMQIINTYGPTECSDLCTTYRVTKEDIIYKKVVPVGKILPNISLYILTSNLRLVPVGGIGELYIGGVGVGEGYINASELTAERFIPNPFDKENKSKLYKTGDFVRYLPDGNIEFLGRIDDQVKIRGFRVELGEIESTLNEHEDVFQAVVAVSRDEFGNKKIIAYVVLKEKFLYNFSVESIFTSSSGEKFSILEIEESSSPTETLSNYLALSLPEYMIPSFFIYLDKIPFTPNNKVDRKALPAPAIMITNDDHVVPNTLLEKELYAIWSEVLGVEKLNIHDNFFKLGGNPIDCIRVVNKARKRGINLLFKDIIGSSTIFSLSDKHKDNALIL